MGDKQAKLGKKNLRIIWRVTDEQRRAIDELVEWSNHSISWWLNEACSQVILKEWARLWLERHGGQEGDE